LLHDTYWFFGRPHRWSTRRIDWILCSRTPSIANISDARRQQANLFNIVLTYFSQIIPAYFYSCKRNMAMQEKSRVIMSPGFEYGDSPSKRRRISSGQNISDGSWTPLPSIVLPKNNIARGYGNPAPRFEGLINEDHVEGEESITISATSKQATQTVAPFLAKHIPEQYAPMGGLDHSGGSTSKETNTKYCYRHRPDLKCRRQVNEPSMDQLQHVSFEA